MSSGSVREKNKQLQILLSQLMTKNVMEIKRLDQSIALEIAGFAGMPTRDARGNLLAQLWSKHTDNSDVGLLIERNDIRVLLLKQIEAQIREQKNSINLLEENDVVCRWIMEFTNSWEKVYTEKKQQNFDIGQTVLSAMNEAFFSVEKFLEEFSEFRPSVLRVRLEAFLQKYKSEELKKDFEGKMLEVQQKQQKQTDEQTRPSKVQKTDAPPASEGSALHAKKTAIPHKPYEPQIFLHTLDNAVIRFLFRNEYFGMHMRRVAGKLLKKQEVCNKPGAYSAKVQRNDITQEVNEALDQFCRVLQEDVMRECMQKTSDDTYLLKMCFDHRGLPMFDDMHITST